MSFENDSVSQKEYLKKYLSGDVKKKKKKKVAVGTSIKRSTIIDDDIDLKNMRPLDDDEVELYQMDEDAPQIAGIIDERPAELKAQEFYSSKRWKVFGGDDGVKIEDSMDKNQQSVSEKLSTMSKDFDKKSEQKLMSSKTQPEKRKTKERPTKSSESDTSLPRNGNLYKTSSKVNKSKTKHSNSDESQYRQKSHVASCHDDSDVSPPRGNERPKYDSDPSPPRLKKHTSQHDSDVSPPRSDRKYAKSSKNKHSSHPSPVRKDLKQKSDRYHSDSDGSHSKRESRRQESEKYRIEYKRTRKSSGSSSSPPRRDRMKKFKHKSDSDNSPPRKQNKRSHRRKSYVDSDESPPRRKEEGSKKNYGTSRRRARSGSSDSDSSPPRRDRHKSPGLEKNKRKRSRSNTPLFILPIKPDILISSQKSPTKTPTPRLSRKDLVNEKRVKRRFSDSDDSPPRRRSDSFRHEGSGSDLSPVRKNSSVKEKKQRKKELYKPNDSSSSDETSKSRSKKMKTTLDGKQAGLQDAKELRKELSDLKMKEDAMFSKMDASVSGKGAAVVQRDRKTGQIRDLEKEKEAQKEKEAKASIVNEKYSKWGKGIKQVDDAAERVKEVMKEMNKPLARYIDDNDLDNFLKAQEREGDPMLDYIKKKQSEATPLTEVKPVYKGTFNANRFGIRPGYRWDGVVRSNGYEQEWFKTQNAKKARDEEAYKWSTSDM